MMARKKNDTPDEVEHVDAAAGVDQMHVRVAYHKGPPAITFYGRDWRRDVAQSIPIEDWIAMNNRPDIAGFGFTEKE